MNILAFDTSSETLSIAAAQGEKILEARDFQVETRHSEHLVLRLKELMKDMRWGWKDVSCLAVSVGPGSFTGLRVGLMTAKTAAYALNKKLVGVSSLEILAWPSANFEGEIAAVLDARKGKVYACIFQGGDRRLKILKAPFLTTIEALMKNKKKDRLFVDAPAPKFSRATFLVKAASARVAARLFTDPFDLEPLYLHPRDCNVTRK